VGFGDFAAFATGAGCLTAIVLTLIRATFGARNRIRDNELYAAREQFDQQARHIADLTRQNEQLHEQLEWHFRLLESYERVLGQPTSRNGDDRLLASRAPARN
jgi:hypothetical protein